MQTLPVGQLLTSRPWAEARAQRRLAPPRAHPCRVSWPLLAWKTEVAGDLAVTLFARRGVGCTWRETHVLALRDGEWTWLGGGGSSDHKDLLTDRPAVFPRFPSLVQGSSRTPISRMWSSTTDVVITLAASA